MLSFVNSSCSSSKDSEPRADERDSDQLPPHEAKPAVRFEGHTKNFSIRDHVLASRSKNIGASWPFPRQLLQICLKNGIRDLLPPFESPSSVRSAHCLVKPVSEVETFSNRSAQLGQILLLDGSGESELKKFKLTQKPKVISESSLEEEIISSTSMASDIMTSKICPVCKAFSSTSNTTLNAHMDQCLSLESDATLAVAKNEKIKAIKPRKKRLLVDIYATTTVCTLEDLDRRNGTSWAIDLNSSALTVGCNSEAKKPKLAESDTRNEKSDGAVYVDSNGIKIRILSNINDDPNVSSKEEFWPRKNIEVVPEGRIMSLKKDYFGASSSKRTKLTLRNKKLRSLKLLENEVQKEVSHREESHVEEKGIQVHISGALERSLNCGSANLKNWPSSKRSHLPKKSAKAFHKIFEHFKPNASENPSASKNHFGELPGLLESKITDFPSNIVQNMEIEEKSSHELSPEGTTANALLRRLPRVSESMALSPRSTSEDFCKGRTQKPHTSPRPHLILTKSCHLVPKTKKISNLSSSESRIIKMGKHRSLLACTDKQRNYSEMQDDHNMCLGTLTGASSGDTGAWSEERDRPVDSNDKTIASMPIRPFEQVAKRTPFQLENRCFESQAKATSEQEFSACLTRHEMELDNPRKEFSLALDQLLPKQDKNLASGREPSVSPGSSASSISPASPQGYHSKASEINPILNTPAFRENLNFPLSFTELKEGNHEMDIKINQQLDKQCCCSWQSLMAGMKQKPLSNLYIRPSNPCFYGNSRAESIAPSMESPTESIVTKAFSDVGSTSPSCGTPTQSSSNSILRLMGKDLMVVNNEESTRQIPKIHSPTVQALPSPSGLASTYASSPNHGSFTFAVRNQSPTTMSLQERDLLPGFEQIMNHKPHMTKEMVVFDGSNEGFAPRDTHTSLHTMSQGSFSYFPLHAHSLQMADGIRPSNPIHQGSPFPASHLQRPFVFQSPAAHFNSSFHYPQSLR